MLWNAVSRWVLVILQSTPRVFIGWLHQHRGREGLHPSVDRLIPFSSPWHRSLCPTAHLCLRLLSPVLPTFSSSLIGPSVGDTRFRKI
jgi:hypothetical protein